MRLWRTMRRALFPSRTLSLYVARLFVLRFLMFLIGLVAVLQVLDLMGKSNDILSADGATYGALWYYVTLRLPQLISQFTPFAALLGAVSTLASLNQSSEVIVMKSVGLSAYHILAPSMAIGLLIGAGHFVFHETIVVQTNPVLDHWEAHEYATNPPSEPLKPNQVWMMDGATIVEVGTITQTGRVLLLDDVTLYRRNGGSALVAISHADFAIHAGGNWTLHDVDHFTLPDFKQSHSESEPWAVTIPAERFVALAVDPDATDVLALGRSIRELQREGYPVDSLEAAFHHKLSGPLASFLMPLLAAVAAFGLARGGHLFFRVVIAMALGFAYFIADNFMLSMVEFGAAPAVLSAWAPFLMFLMMGLTVLFYTEE